MTPARSLLSLAIISALAGTPFSLAYAENLNDQTESGLVIEIT